MTTKMPMTPEYYRDKLPGVPAQPGPTEPGPQGPVPDGVVWGEANVANVGPLKAGIGKGPVEVEIPCQIAPLGTLNQPVRLVKNDYQKPMFVRIRLARMSTEGRIAVGPFQGFVGAAGTKNVEWLNLFTASDHKFEAMMGVGESLWALGTWAGVVPLSIFVTVSTWNS